jgi:very-short-patch-repair endonuclease/transposase
MFDKTKIQEMLEQGFSLAEICSIHNCNYHKVYRWCKNNEVLLSRANNGKSLTVTQARAKARAIPDSDRDLLRQMYVDQDMSLADIAAHFKTTSATVAATLRRFNIPVKLQNGKYQKTKPTQPRSVLEQLYITNQLSTHEIASLLGYKHHGQVVEELKYYNIDRRNYKEAGALLYKKRPEKRQLHREQFYAGITGPKHQTLTSLEQKFIDWADTNNIAYVYQFQIRKNWHRYDFLLSGTNIIVEMDGDFWHSLPEHVDRDAKFDETARRHGYTVVRIRESVVQSNNRIFDEILKPMIKEVSNADT